MSAGGRFAVLAVACLAAVGTAGGGSSASVPKVTLTVVVTGNGGVVSHPAGIACPSTCKIRVRRGTRVVLAAQPDEGSQLGSWTAGCGAKPTCALTMTVSKTVAVSFKTPPPPPPPPPPAKAGHYKGTYSDGGNLEFDVGGAGTSFVNVLFDNNGHCSDGGNEYGGQGYVPGPIPIQPDGSFSTTFTYTFSNGDVEVTTFGGRFVSDGTASGTANVAYTFGPSGQYAGINCTSTGTWTATLQP